MRTVTESRSLPAIWRSYSTHLKFTVHASYPGKLFAYHTMCQKLSWRLAVVLTLDLPLFSMVVKSSKVIANFTTSFQVQSWTQTARLHFPQDNRCYCIQQHDSWLAIFDQCCQLDVTDQQPRKTHKMISAPPQCNFTIPLFGYMISCIWPAAAAAFQIQGDLGTLHRGLSL